MNRETARKKAQALVAQMTVGFIDKATGHFHDLRRVDGQKELDEFCESIGVSDIKTIY